jgi:lysophospholipase L1-like esterase
MEMIVCLGDSLTYGYAVDRKHVWPALAEKELGIPVLNRGVNGLMTAGMLGLCTQDLVNGETNAVMLMGGANDILSGLDAAEPLGNMATLIDKVRGMGGVPLCGIPIPFCPPIRKDWAAMADFPKKTPVYERYAERLRALAREKACPAVDFRAGLAGHTESVGVAMRSFYIDGVHLNGDGHRVFAAVFIRALRECALV